MVERAEQEISNRTITYVVRCHSVATVPMLCEALLSIAGQQYTHTAALIALQDLPEDSVRTIEEAAELVSAGTGLKYTIRNFSFGQPGDNRGALLNKAFQHVTSRYIAVLDYDDVIYPNHARILIADLMQDENAVASFCGCTRAHYDHLENGQIFITSKKDFCSDASVARCIMENCFPIHSYVLDMKRIDDKPKFWEEYSVFEDYWFLLQLFEKYQVSTRCVTQQLCEYRLANGGGNTVLHTAALTRNNPDLSEKWNSAAALIDEKKQRLSYKIPYDEILQGLIPTSYRSAIPIKRIVLTFLHYRISRYVKKRYGNDDASNFLRNPEMYIRKIPRKERSLLMRLIF